MLAASRSAFSVPSDLAVAATAATASGSRPEVRHAVHLFPEGSGRLVLELAT